MDNTRKDGPTCCLQLLSEAATSEIKIVNRLERNWCSVQIASLDRRRTELCIGHGRQCFVVELA